MNIKALKNKKGQAAWFDIVIIFMCIVIFTAFVFAFTIGGKAAGTQDTRKGQDYTKSLLLSTLYATLDVEDPKYRGKSISDVIGMYLSVQDEEKVSKDFVKKSLEYVKIHEYLKEKGSGVDTSTEWFLYDGDRKLCFHGVGDNIEECSDDKTQVWKSTTASMEIIFPTSVITQSPLPQEENGYGKVPIYLTIKWE